MTRKMRAQDSARGPRAVLIEFALGYPEAHEDHPWGEIVAKVRKKVFVFFGVGSEGFGMAVKLPESREEALLLPFTEPTGYGLGKSGWVSVRFDPDVAPPLGLLRSWIDESYRAVAPKKLVATLSDGGSTVAPATPSRRRKPASAAQGKKATTERKQAETTSRVAKTVKRKKA